ncbi:hypothetical protein IWW34DRAFT_843182 [Fusarium oxysporum f. sp. albedinis]|nr:hypothetical protein IWW34DRAFT_843182 [Fusarium oxysporum f. sp. albedinis]KAK2480161.1 hypothetical protein H9L39_09535 [Fusarium oxysporum f. sp. albedinis]
MYNPSGTQRLEATVPRDIVYALLGMASDRAELGIDPDYTCTYAQFCTNTTKALIVQDINMLLRLNCQGPNTLSHDLPSWAIDWAAPFQRTLIPSDPKYEAAVGTQARVRFIDDETGPVLVISAINVGTVLVNEHAIDSKTCLVKPKGWPGRGRIRPTTRSLTVILQVEKAARLTMVIKSAYATCQERREAVWATATTGLRMVQGTGPRRATAEESHAYSSAGLKSDMRRLSSFRGRSDFSHTSRISAAKYATEQKFFFVTMRGRLGLGTEDIKAGDLVCVALGLHMPIILRSTGNGCYRLVGNAYVHGIMNSEALGKGGAATEMCII